jgi:Lamin Tail Domain
MKKIFTFLLLLISVATLAQVRISQVYGGGGNASATYNQDFVELFNAGAASVSIGGWSVQYASATGTTWAVSAITAGTTIAPGKYFLMAMSTAGATGIALPTPDGTGISNMSATAGKVALVNSTTALSGATACSNASVVDVLGFGSTATCFETAFLVTTGITNAQSMLRGSNGCTDANNNSADFALGAVAPRNIGTAANSCGGPVPTISASPNITNITTTVGVASTSQSFNLSASNLTPAAGNLSIAPSTGLEISFDNSTFFSTPQNFPYTGSAVASTPIYVRISATAAQGALTSANVTCSGGGAASNAVITVAGGVTQNFYSQPTGDLSTLTTWGIATNGTGTTPTSFTSPYQIFNVVNRATAVPGAHWEVSGTASKVIVGDGVASTYLNTSITDTIKATTIVDISNGSGMNMGSRFAPFFGTIGTNTLVNYNFTGTAATDTVRIRPVTYYNLTCNGGIKYLTSGVTIVNNNLVLDASVTNGAPSPFSTVILKGTFFMTGGAIIEDSTTGSGNRFTLTMAGNNNQTIFIDAGSELRLFRLQRDTSVLTNLNINVTANSKICLGNNTSGGLSLLQKTTGTPTVTKLVMGNNSQLAIVKNGIIYTDLAKAGAISSTNGKIIINKSISSTAFPGTLVFETGSTLSDLTVNITTPTRDSITINGNVEIIGNVNLTKGVVVLTPATTMTLAAATTITGGSASSYIDGKVRKLNSSTSTFLFPVGQAKQYAPVEMSGLTASSDFSAQYFKQAYSNTTINATTASTIPGYAVSTKEYWNIDKNGTDNPNIKFYYNTTSLVDAAQARIAHFNTVDWDDIGRDANGTDGVGNYIQKNNVSTFSPFTFGGAAGVLPIVLQSFNGALQNNISSLQWKTTCEDAGDAFELQYSTDGRNFATIHDINAVGNCNGNTYNYLHKNVAASVNYYRLLLKAVNGRTKISNILTLKNSKTNFEITLQSTVVKNQLVFSVTSPIIGVATTIISNMLGQQLYNKNIIHSVGTQLNYIPVEKLGSGMYLLTIKNNNGEVTTMKFIKN